MSTNVTPNLGLCQWEAGDPVLREDFNRDNTLLDGFFAGSPKIAAGVYTGTGVYGPAETPCTLSFDFQPQLVIVVPDTQLSLYGTLVLVQGQSACNGSGFLDSSNRGLNLAVSWGEMSVSWYCDGNGSAEKQFNADSTSYRYFAIGNAA